MPEGTHPEPRLFVRPRAIRVAYLLTNDEHAQTVLDAIFSECNSRWGGRYSLVIPCNNGDLHARYLPWLQAYDPDVVYSYLDLSEAKQASLHELLGPTHLARHERNDRGERDRQYFRPELPIACLTSLSTIPAYSRMPAMAIRPLRLIDYLPNEANNRFLDDNFGSHYDSFGRWPVPPELANVVRPIYFAGAEALARFRQGRGVAEETLPDLPTLLRRMTEDRSICGLSQISADMTPRIEVGRQDSLSLVIGDAFEDRVLFWNDRSLFPAYLGRELTSLIVTPALFDDREFLARLAEFLRERNGVYAQNGQRQVTLKSISVSADRLNGYRNRFNEALGWMASHTRHIASLDEIVPAEGGLAHATALTTGRIFEHSSDWKEFAASGESVRIPQMMPSQLHGIPGRSILTNGSWSLDVDIERQHSLTSTYNLRHKWQLPRRLRMHGAFRGPYEIATRYGVYGYARSTREGYLALYSGYGEDPPPISLPSDEGAFRRALEQGNDWPPFARARAPQHRRGIFSWTRPSDKGRYLLGTLRLFGGLENAGAILLHEYWYKAFQELGAAGARNRIQEIKATLKRRFRGGQIQTEDDWERLAETVAVEAYQVRLPYDYLKFDGLKRRHEPYLEREREILADRDPEDIEEWMSMATDSLAPSVQSLALRRVLNQGHVWRCHTCYNVNWNDIANLGRVLTCDVCGVDEPAPVDVPWGFRLNEFVQDALREHGTLALIWCLSELARRARSSFYFLGPHNLFVDTPQRYRQPPDHEADLICVLDGKVYLCEVKSSFHQIDVQALVGVAQKVRPDGVLLAVMEPESARMRDKLAELRQLLSGDRISAELIALRDSTFRNDAHLPSIN